MRVVFRADASLQMGTGHVMRCLSLAKALRERGTSCEFILREHHGHLFDVIESESFLTHLLPAPNSGFVPVDNLLPHAPWLGVPWEADAKECALLLEAQKADWLVVDHYALDVRWERSLRQFYKRLMVIDDLADRNHDCEILLDQNLGRKSQDYESLVPADCRVLAGSKYALLRPEFAAWRERSLERRKIPGLKSLLIVMGGVDAANATCRVLRALRQVSLPDDFHIKVVMGVQAPWLTHVQQEAATMPVVTEVMVGISNMAEVMADADLAIGAAGSTSWERCCLGLPCLTAVLATNQLVVARSLERVGASKTLELSLIDKELPMAFQELRGMPERLAAMSRAAANVTHGGGVQEVVRALL